MKNRALWLLLTLWCLAAFALRPPVVATVSATTSRVTYSGNGVTTVFSFPYYFRANADLKVWTYNVTSGAQSQKTLTTDYTVTGATVASGGSVTMLVAPPTGTTLVIYDDPSQTQDLSMSDSGPFSAKQIELRLDKLTLMVQRLSDEANRSIRLKDGDASGFNPTMPETITANAVFAADPTGKFLVMGAQQASAAQTAQLIGGGDADPLHFHGSDRARANHTGTQLAATVSDFSAAVLLVATPTAIGAVTSSRTLTAGTGLSGGGDLSANRTFNLADTTVTPGGYGSAILIPTFTVDQQGRLTAAAAVAPQFTTTQLSASAGILGTQLDAAANILYTQLETRTLTAGTGLSGGGTLAADRSFALANTAVTPGSYGLAASVPQFTVDAQGRLTAAANVAISGLGDAALTNGTLYLKKDGTVAMTAALNFAGFEGTNFLMENIAAGAIPAASSANRGRILFDVTAGEFVYSNGTNIVRATENPSGIAHAIPIAQNVPTTNYVMTFNGSNVVWAAAGAGAAIAVQSNGSLVTGSPAATLNFNGGLQAGNVSGGVSAVSVATDGITLAMINSAVKSPAQGAEGTRQIYTSTPAAPGTAGSAGASVLAAAGDHVHAAPSVTVNGTAHGATTTLTVNGDVASSTSSGTTTLNVSGSVPAVCATLNVSASSATVVNIQSDAIAVYDGTTSRVLVTVNVTPSTGTAGSAANGRDQSGAFGNNVWIYGWVIWGSGQPVAGLWSLSATAPTLPASYTHKALVTAVNTQSGTGVGKMYRQIGRMALYAGPFNAAPQRILSAGASTTFASVGSLEGIIPPQANAALCALSINPNAAGNTLTLAVDGGSTVANLNGQVVGVQERTSIILPLSSAHQVQYKVASASDSAQFDVVGWIW